MIINFSSRDKARKFAQQRTANGITTKVTDNGASAAKRYVVSLARVSK